jgi:hypothetical protein
MLFIQNFQICQAHIVLCLYYTGAWKTLPRKTMAHSHESSFTSNYLIFNCQKGRVSLPLGVGKHASKHVHATPANLGLKMVNVLSAWSHSFLNVQQAFIIPKNNPICCLSVLKCAGII